MSFVVEQCYALVNTRPKALGACAVASRRTVTCIGTAAVLLYVPWQHGEWPHTRYPWQHGKRDLTYCNTHGNTANGGISILCHDVHEPWQHGEWLHAKHPWHHGERGHQSDNHHRDALSHASAMATRRMAACRTPVATRQTGPSIIITLDCGI